MKERFSLLVIIAVLAVSLPVTTNAATQVYDLKTDWSDTHNPNGTWSFRDSLRALLSNDPLPWTSWYDGYPEFVARTGESDVIAGYLELGDISVAPGLYGLVVRWTAPANGTINLSGTTWYAEDYLAEASWTLEHNGNALSSGFSGDGIPTRDLPYDFLSSGSGGASALQNIAVQAGHRIELVFQMGSGQRLGVNFTITLTTDSADPVAAIENLAIAVVEMNLQSGIENSLDSKLDAALGALEDANVNNDGAAFNSLAAFISAVEAQRGNKITDEQADQLIAAAQEIQGLLQ